MKPSKRLTSDAYIDAGIHLLQALSAAPDHTLSHRAACDLAGCDERQLPEIVSLLDSLSDRLSGARVIIANEAAALRLEGDAAQLLPLRLDIAESVALAHVLGTLDIDAATATRIREGLLLLDTGNGADKVAETERFGRWYQTLSEAIEDGVRCTIAYHSSSDTCAHHRRVDPLSLEVAPPGTAYLLAWNVAKDAPRRYRLDRIESVELTEESVERHEMPAPTIEESLQACGEEVVLAVRDDTLLDTITWAGITDIEVHSGQATRLHVQCTSREWLFDQVFAHAGALEIISPDDMRRACRQRAQELIAERQRPYQRQASAYAGHLAADK